MAHPWEQKCGTKEGDLDVVEAIVEIPRGSRNKYEIDHTTGAIREVCWRGG